MMASLIDEDDRLRPAAEAVVRELDTIPAEVRGASVARSRSVPGRSNPSATRSSRARKAPIL
jgi:hypothetical protein